MQKNHREAFIPQRFDGIAAPAHDVLRVLCHRTDHRDTQTRHFGSRIPLPLASTNFIAIFAKSKIRSIATESMSSGRAFLVTGAQY